MKKSIMLISLLLIIGLSACGNNAAQSSHSEADGYIAVTVEPAQEEMPDEPEESAPPPVLISEEWIEVEEEQERATVRRALYDGGQELVFHWDATIIRFGRLRTYDDNSEVFEPPTSDYQSYERGVLTIENNAGDIIQQIEHRNQWSIHPGFHITPPLFFADLNFDGYLDIYLQSLVMSNLTYVFYSGFVWNPELGRFIETRLREIYNFWLDPEIQAIRGSRGHQNWRALEIWRFVDGDFVLTNDLVLNSHAPDEDGVLIFNYFIGTDGEPTTILERELVDGKLVDVWPLISDTEEGRAIIYEHLFGENSIWFPGQ